MHKYKIILINEFHKNIGYTVFHWHVYDNTCLKYIFVMNIINKTEHN